MSRRNTPPKRIVPADKKYNNVHVTMFVNRMMEGGKRSTALAIMYRAFEIIEERAKREPIEVFEQALRNVAPAVEVKPMRVGGSTYQVPVEISFERQESLALRWIVTAAGTRKGVPMRDALAAEIVDAYNNTGSVVKKKEDTHRMAEANKAFAHYRW